MIVLFIILAYLLLGVLFSFLVDIDWKEEAEHFLIVSLAWGMLLGLFLMVLVAKVLIKMVHCCKWKN